MTDITVVALPRQAKPLIRGTLGACTRFIAGQAAPDMTRLALVVSTPPPDQGPDGAVCVPMVAFASWEEQAASVVDGWEAWWLLISSMQARHREEARADLLHAVAAALAAAAVNGIDSTGRPDDLAF